ncbi:unnamed protein product [Gongylonema pulchrum]|uniref:Adipocyte plasma membrane-associated protein n=1 Tax=Gongylonema pulchrum TaxID=637853 RepID=A0A183D5F3_9BILA|nr:unnamed protein product [Gongylonema pulchrum]
MYATVLATVTHKPLRIVDVDVRQCLMTNLEKSILRKQRKQCRASDNKVVHKRDKHQKQRLLVVNARSRPKRSISASTVIEFIPKKAPYHIAESITVAANQVLRIHAGTRLIFDENSGIIAHGAVQMIGTKEEPILLYPQNNTWRGILLTFNNAAAAKQSLLKHVNVSKSELGVRIESTLIPEIENFISDSNGNGLTILAYSNNNNEKTFQAVINCTLKKIIAVNNREHGLSIYVSPRHLVKSLYLQSSRKANRP